MKNKGTYIYTRTNLGRKFNQWIPACGNDKDDCSTDFPTERINSHKTTNIQRLATFA